LSEKVNLAIIDKDLTVRSIKKYSLSTNGRQILVISGGENHFMPAITNTSYLKLPIGAKRFVLFGKKGLKQVYFAMNKAEECVDFASGHVSMPSPEEMKRAISSTMLGQIGKEKTDMTWWNWAVLIFSFLSFLILIATSGVLR
jgi:hypothetical protein